MAPVYIFSLAIIVLLMQLGPSSAFTCMEVAQLEGTYRDFQVRCGNHWTLSAPLEKPTAKDFTECGDKCLLNPQCVSFRWANSSNTCEHERSSVTFNPHQSYSYGIKQSFMPLDKPPVRGNCEDLDSTSWPGFEIKCKNKLSAYPGPQIRYFSGINFSECLERCKSDITCGLAEEYRSSQSHACYLYSAYDRSKWAFSAYDSGLKANLVLGAPPPPTTTTTCVKETTTVTPDNCCFTQYV